MHMCVLCKYSKTSSHVLLVVLVNLSGLKWATFQFVVVEVTYAGYGPPSDPNDSRNTVKF